MNALAGEISLRSADGTAAMWVLVLPVAAVWLAGGLISGLQAWLGRPRPETRPAPGRPERPTRPRPETRPAPGKPETRPAGGSR